MTHKIEKCMAGMLAAGVIATACNGANSFLDALLNLGIIALCSVAPLFLAWLNEGGSVDMLNSREYNDKILKGE